MTKDSRKASSWTTREIEEDSAGYLDAQANEHLDQALGRERERERRERADFAESFVVHGGKTTDAAEAYETTRRERATEAATLEDEQARRVLEDETRRRM